jgi:hypothetical protein
MQVQYLSLSLSLKCSTNMGLFIGLAYQGKDIVFRFIIEYSSLRDFGTYEIYFYVRIFER